MKTPEGWPTEEMVRAFKKVFRQGSWNEGIIAGIKAALATAPTPPAQDFVAHGEISNSVDDHKTAKVRDKAPAQEDEPISWKICDFCDDSIPVYTRPDDKLREAAEELIRIWDEEFDDATFERAIENLRAALEGK